MLRHVVAFEARYQLRSPLFWVGFVLFFLLAFGATVSDDIQIGARGNVHVNSPYAILQTIATMNVMALFIITAFVANVVIRDDETGFAPILRATRIGKFDYLIGRFIGALCVAVLVVAAVPLAMLIGSLMPWLDAEKLGPLVIGHYLYAIFVLTVPTMFMMGALFFTLATLTRSMMWSYVGLVAVLVLFIGTRVLLRDQSFDTISGLTDPFGVGTISRVTKYWTSTERNTQLPPLSGVFLYNRLIWIGVGALLLGLGYALFRFETRSTSSKGGASTADASAQPTPKPLARPSATSGWTQALALARFDMAAVFKSPAFFVLLLIGVLNAIASLALTVTARGINYFPVTRSAVEALAGSYTFIPMIIAAYYAGELVWRNREQRMHEIVDATAAPNWAFMVPKVLAIVGVLLATYVVGALTGLGFQLLHGYTDFQLEAYALWFVLPGLIFAVEVGALSIFVQALVPHKFVGWAVMLVYVVAAMVLGSLGFEHRLYNFADTPPVPLSDMNDMGRFWIGRAWLQAYWMAFSLMLLVGAHLMWRRGAETRLKPRFARLVPQLKGPAGVLMGVGAVLWIGIGAYVYYNINVLNLYRPQPEYEDWQAKFEKTLLPFQKLPQPTITHVRLNVALFPHAVRAEASGEYDIENHSGQPLSRVDVEFNPELKQIEFDLPGAMLEKEYPDFGHRIYHLATPMQPGEKRVLGFKAVLEERGFPNSAPLTVIVDNGTFVNNFNIAPVLGVSHNFLMVDRAKRRKHDLPAELRPPKLEDQSARAHHYLRHDSDWVTADITLSTDADQTPVAPGYTVSDTTANGRRTLVTKTESPIMNFFSLQSARYSESKTTWTPKPGSAGEPVQLAVFYDPKHDHNVQRMLDAMKVSLDTFSTAFSPFQFRQLRITEFPTYETFAQSFANTVPFSEGIGFIQNFDESKRDENVDLVTYVTAHEVGHQWWAHQLIGADQQGDTLLSETFAQYSALLVMERLYGRDQIRKFLKYELDAYLRARGAELIEELPLNRVENQPYIHYRKGAVVMYGLKEIVGEDVVNRAMQKLLAQYAFKPAPYPQSTDFIRLLRAEAGPKYDSLITDMFEKITLYDLKASAATSRKLADGTFELTFKVDAKKLYADGKGKETEAALDEPIDIGVFTAEPGKQGFGKDSVLLMERRPIKSGQQTIKVVVKSQPKFVGIDPYNMRIDRNSDDNVVKVEAP
ncbi:MAG TPA: M1 family aminopeptidase [Burkholderiaceae bacterium]|jgi:aminopeptidase N